MEIGSLDHEPATHDGGPLPPNMGGLVDISSSCRGEKTGSCACVNCVDLTDQLRRGEEKSKNDSHRMSLGHDERGGNGQIVMGVYLVGCVSLRLWRGGRVFDPGPGNWKKERRKKKRNPR